MRNAVPRDTIKRSFLILLAAAFAASAIGPYDRATWLLEVFPVVLGIPVMLWLERRHGVTSLVFALVIVHCLVLVYGGAYTYARVPLGFWMQEWFGFVRNDYDKIGHFMQGFVPALIAREVLVRAARLANRRYLAFLCVSVSLAISACYELIEWWAALALGQGADEFLGTQGDPWDTQSDMFMALLGALCSLAILSKAHDRALARVGKAG